MKVFGLLLASVMASYAATITVGVACDYGAVHASSGGAAIACVDPDATYNGANGSASVTESSTQIAINSSIDASFSYIISKPSGPTSAYANITETFITSGTGSGYLAFGGGLGDFDGGMFGFGIADLTVYVNGVKVEECVDLCTNPFPFSTAVPLGTSTTVTINELAGANTPDAYDQASTAVTVSAFAADGTAESLTYAPEPRSIALAGFGILLLAAVIYRLRSTSLV